jgi:hypothetical protein
MPRRRSERGEGNLGCIIWVLILAIGALIAFKAVPAKMRSAEFYDFMDEMAKFSAAGSTREALEKAILARADELDIPLEKRNLSINLQRERIRIEVKYTLPLDFPGYTYYWDFHHVLDRQIFLV